MRLKERKKRKRMEKIRHPSIYPFLPQSIHPSICLLAQKSATKVWYIEVIKNTEHGMSK